MIEQSRGHLDKVSYCFTPAECDSAEMVGRLCHEIDNVYNGFRPVVIEDDPLYMYSGEIILAEENALFLQWGNRMPGRPPLRTEWNPARCDVDARELIIDFLAWALPNPVQNIMDATVSRFDLAVDVYGAGSLNNVFLATTHARSMHHELWIENGIVVGITVGGKGKNQMRLYDKGWKQLKDTGVPFQRPDPRVPGAMHESWIRVEAELRPHKSWVELATGPNQLNRFIIADGEAARAQVRSRGQRAFMTNCFVTGAQRALQRLSDSTRTRYRRLLASHPVTWYDKARAWTDGSRELTRVLTGDS